MHALERAAALRSPREHRGILAPMLFTLHPTVGPCLGLNGGPRVGRFLMSEVPSTVVSQRLHPETSTQRAAALGSIAVPQPSHLFFFITLEPGVE